MSETWNERIRRLQDEKERCPKWLRALMGEQVDDQPEFDDTRILTCACGSKVYQDCDSGRLRNDYHGTLHQCETP